MSSSEYAGLLVVIIFGFFFVVSILWSLCGTLYEIRDSLRK
jgi:hypothetical protein